MIEGGTWRGGGSGAASASCGGAGAGGAESLATAPPGSRASRSATSSSIRAEVCRWAYSTSSIRPVSWRSSSSSRDSRTSSAAVRERRVLRLGEPDLAELGLKLAHLHA